jgi:hypothetical protein
MALTVLKLTPMHCVVKSSHSTTATDTIALATTLLANTREVAGTCKVNIVGIYWSVPTAGQIITITRNSVQLYGLSGTFSLQYNGFTDIQENVSNIVCAIPAGGGSVIIELLKVSGYGNTQHLNSLI